MATKKYTAAELRKAREIIDQEEAIEYERERRTKAREARRDKQGRVEYMPPAIPEVFRSPLLALILFLLAFLAIFVPGDGFAGSIYEGINVPGKVGDNPRWVLAVLLGGSGTLVSLLRIKKKL
jgi:hypothetical protein